MKDVSYIEPEELAKLLIESPDDIAVIDVREADYTVLNNQLFSVNFHSLEKFEKVSIFHSTYWKAQ